MLRRRQTMLWLLTLLVVGYLGYAWLYRSNDNTAAQLHQTRATTLRTEDTPTTTTFVPTQKAQNSVPKSGLRTIRPQRTENRCKSYLELRNIDFLQPALQETLCSGVKAYVKTATGYPMCKLPNPFDHRLLDVVRQGSHTADLMDMRNDSVKMFVYPEADYISEKIKMNQAWEPQLVHTILKLAQLVPGATFLDAGCNIGVYSIQAARLGLPVVSLDANIRNLLRLRLTLSSASLDAALVWNFIGSGAELSYLNFPGNCNVGGATKFGREVNDTIPVMPLRSERLCDLISTSNVVIKLDVEGGEADFLRTSGRLFSEFSVAAVQMEYMRRHMVGNDSSSIIQFFTSRRYSVWSTPGLSELDWSDTSSWENVDIIWVRHDFRHLIHKLKDVKKRQGQTMEEREERNEEDRRRMKRAGA